MKFLIQGMIIPPPHMSKSGIIPEQYNIVVELHQIASRVTEFIHEGQAALALKANLIVRVTPVPEVHERRVVGHASGLKEYMNACVCGAPWPCHKAKP